MPVSADVKLSTLAYIILYVKDTKKSVPFYRDTLGLKVKANEEGWVELESGAVTLALHGHDQHKPIQSETQPIVVFQVENVQQAYEGLKAKGVKFHSEPHIVCEAGPEQVGKSADFEDLDGNRLSIFGLCKK
jgi:lactoylglutathione lyase